MVEQKTNKRRLIVSNQVFGPLMCQLLGDLSNRGVSCKAITGWADIPKDQPVPYGLSKAVKLKKHPAWRRLLTWGMFTLQAAWRLAFTSAPALISTNPPWTLLLAPWLKRIFGLRYALLVYDIYPDVAESMGMITPGGFVSRLWRRLSRNAMVHAEGVITIGKNMGDTLAGHLSPGDNVTIDIIPNWADTDFIKPMPKEENQFAKKHGLVGKMVVTYSGAFGKTHGIESIIRAAELLQDLPDIHFMLIGGGTQQEEVSSMVASKQLKNLTLLVFQPWDTLPYSLAASDCCIVSLDENFGGVSVPSKVFYALAAGAAILAVTGQETELAELVSEHKCGTHVPSQNPEKLAETIRSYYDQPKLLADHQSEARRLAETQYSLKPACKRYMELFSRWFWLDGQ